MISLFGQNCLDKYDPSATNFGLRYTDNEFDTTFSGVIAAGVLPKEISSTLLNSALRQATFAGYIFSNVLLDLIPNIDYTKYISDSISTNKSDNDYYIHNNSSLETVSVTGNDEDATRSHLDTNNSSEINPAIAFVSTYLAEIDNIITGATLVSKTVTSDNALKYITKQNETYNIDDKLGSLNTAINTLKSNIESGTLIVDCASDYSETGTINNKLSDLRSKRDISLLSINYYTNIKNSSVASKWLNQPIPSQIQTEVYFNNLVKNGKLDWSNAAYADGITWYQLRQLWSQLK